MHHRSKRVVPDHVPNYKLSPIRSTVKRSIMILKKQKLIRMIERHLNESKMWNELSGKYSGCIYAQKYANDRADEHLRMCAYWMAAVKNMHYVPGTWRVVY